MSLKGPPSEAHLERLYFELAQLGAPSVGRKRAWPYRPREPEQLLTLAGDMLRFDPRLLSVLLELVLERWQQFNPVILRKEMGAMDHPQALLVLFEFAKSATRDPELRHYADYLAKGWNRVSPPERFFLDGPRPASRLDQRRGALSLKEYSRWGFVGLERPSTHRTRKDPVGKYDSNARAIIRRRLAERKGAFTLSDYLHAIDHSVSRQQAYFDLRDDPDFRPQGRGRGARWRFSKKASRTGRP